MGLLLIDCSGESLQGGVLLALA